MRAQGGLKYQKKLTPHKIIYRLRKHGVDMDEAVLIEDLLLQMLEFVPGKSQSAG